MPFFRRVGAWFKRCFTSCYGGDHLSMALTYASLFLILLGALPRAGALLAVAYALVIVSFIRMFSRNIAARRRENEWFLRKTAPLITRFYQARARFRNRKTTVYFRCPGCRARLKLPRGAGHVTVVCGRCGNRADKRA